ncbi:AAA family ATPase [Candidatus Poribacteria bacterium]|nr:AAA family ATPase [Candidatus Poribacteria bacterium]
MLNRLTRLHIQNFRSLANVSVETHAINVLFGPNGSGKSTLLDAIWFVRDCLVRDVAEASSKRSHGIGMLWQGAQPGANISIKFETNLAEYEISLGFSAGSIVRLPGELLSSKDGNVRLIDRKIGRSDAKYYYHDKKEELSVSDSFRQPDNLALTSYQGAAARFPEVDKNRLLPAAELERLLRSVRFHHSHDVDLYELKQRGSESNYHTTLLEGCRNLWSVLRNLHGKQAIDERYETIISFMRKSFPLFKDLVFEQTGPNSVYCSFSEKGRRELIPESGMSDGHIQMLVLLTALFSEVKGNDPLILLDEPDTSLHPYALSVFAQAVELATDKWNKQVFIATHSPVLISQFESEDILAAELDESGQTVLTRVSDMEDIKDLLENYATGSLYMAEAIAPQSHLKGVNP